MSDPVKRKSKAMYIKEALDIGLVVDEAMSVPEIKKLIADKGADTGDTPVEITDPVQEIERYNGKEDCEHDYFRKIREIRKTGNILFKVCRKCGHKEKVDD